RAHLPGDAQRQDPVEGASAACIEGTHVLELGAVAVGSRARQVDADRREVLDGEGTGRLAHGGELAGEVERVGHRLVHPGVDPGQVALVAGLEGGRQRGDYRVDLGGRVEVAPRLDVHRDVALAQDLGEVPGGGAP